MAIQLSTTVRNARLDQIETTIGTAPKLQFFTAAAANCAAADSGTKLVDTACPSDWLAAAASGAKAIATGPWALTGIAAGSVAQFRIKDSSGTTCHLQGTVTATGGGGDMTVDNVVIANAQAVSITAFTLTDGNA